jgi:hypothetical protein
VRGALGGADRTYGATRVGREGSSTVERVPSQLSETAASNIRAYSRGLARGLRRKKPLRVEWPGKDPPTATGPSR